MLPLSAFAARRLLSPWFLAGFLALLALAVRGSATAPLVPEDPAGAAALGALARQNVWSVLVACAPLFLFRAACLGTAQAGAWLAPTPSLPLARTAALALGCVLAAGAAILVTALASEAGVSGEGRAWRRDGHGPSPRAVLLEDAPRVRWEARAPDAGQRLRLWTTVAPGSGPAVTARFTARAGTASATIEARVAGRSALELAPPGPAAGRLELELERVGSGAVLVLPPEALEFLAQAPSARLAAVTVGLHALLVLGSGCVLALGLARWLRPVLAAGSVAALALLAWTAGATARTALAAGPRAWRELAEGLVPGAPAGASWVAAGLLAGLGIALQGLGRGRP